MDHKQTGGQPLFSNTGVKSNYGSVGSQVHRSWKVGKGRFPSWSDLDVPYIFLVVSGAA